MKIVCHGASGEVGRSSFLLEDRNTRILLDCGVKFEECRTQSFPMPVKGYIDAVLLSHAHMDHSGALPVLFQKSECPCFLTPPTIPLTEILLKDSIKIATLNDEPIPFNETHVKNYMRNCAPTKCKKKKSINTDFQFEFMDAGHVLGAAFTLIYGEDYNIAYTGDIKLEDTEMHHGAKWPKQNFDVLITETTYAIDHPPRKELVKEFIDEVKDQLNKDRPVICPAFAVGRSQELITVFNENKIQAPIYLDGMAKAVSEIYVDYLNYIRKGNEFMGALNRATWVENSYQRSAALKGPNIIITTAGMLNGGPINDYLLKLGDRQAGIFMTGFQVKGTPGRILLDTLKYVSNGKTLDLSHCNIRKFDFSAHAGISELKMVAKRSNPKLVIAVHGDKENSEIYKKQVEEELGLNTIVPHFGQKFDIDEMI